MSGVLMPDPSISMHARSISDELCLFVNLTIFARALYVQNCLGTNITTLAACRLIYVYVHMCLLRVPSSFDEEPVDDQGGGGGVLEAATAREAGAGSQRRIPPRGTVLLHVINYATIIIAPCIYMYV